MVGFPIHYVLKHCTNSLSAIIAAKKPAGMLWADFHLFEQLTSFPTWIFHFEQVKLVGFPIRYVLTHCTNSLSAIIAAKKPAGMLWADFHLFEQLTSFPTCRCFYLIVFSLLAPCSSLLDATTYGWVIVIFFFPMLKRCYWLLHVCWTLVNQRKFLSF